MANPNNHPRPRPPALLICQVGNPWGGLSVYEIHAFPPFPRTGYPKVLQTHSRNKHAGQKKNPAGLAKRGQGSR